MKLAAPGETKEPATKKEVVAEAGAEKGGIGEEAEARVGAAVGAVAGVKRGGVAVREIGATRRARGTGITEHQVPELYLFIFFRIFLRMLLPISLPSPDQPPGVTTFCLTTDVAIGVI